MCLAQGHNADAGEARTRGPSVSSQALYYWATALPHDSYDKNISQAKNPWLCHNKPILFKEFFASAMCIR